jgi:hypothetical protein
MTRPLAPTPAAEAGRDEPGGSRPIQPAGAPAPSSSAPARPDSAGPQPPTGAPLTQDRWLLAVLVLVVGNFMAVLDVTIVNVAVPSIQKDFGGALDDVLWIATAYTLMLGLVVPVSG